MSLSTGHWTCTRPFIFSNLLVIGLLVLCFLYNGNVKLPSLGVSFHSMGLHFHTSPSCSQRLHTNQTNATMEHENEVDTILLIWMWPFGTKFDQNCDVFGIKNCYFTDDRSLYHKADGVLFHHRDVYLNLSDLPKSPRPCFQKWVWTNMESPDNSPPAPVLNDLFNLTCNYRLDSNIPVPYGHLVPLSSEDPVFQLPLKDKLVCWIVSNWNNDLLRVQYYNKLKDHIQINTYGSAFKSPIDQQTYINVISSCKFYLAFENSVYKDYVTEKLFSPMMLGSVPIVLGPSRQNYQAQIPGDAFIHVNDFASPKELADRLHHLDQHPDEYRGYFRWRSEYKVKMFWFGKEHACKTCRYLQKHREHEVFHNLIKWYWG